MKLKVGDKVRIRKDWHSRGAGEVFRIAEVRENHYFPYILDDGRFDDSRFHGGWTEKNLDLVERAEDIYIPSSPVAEDATTDDGLSQYGQNIVKLLKRQHQKGMKKYGETLEDNTTLSREQRIEHLQEELIDGLQYCEHIKATLADELSVNDYCRMALRTSGEYDSWYEKLRNAIYGLNGEAGECIDILKKHEFQGHDFDRDHMIEELGDVAWYLPLAADALGITLEEILLRNIEKLKKRYPDGFDKARSINRNVKAENGI